MARDGIRPGRLVDPPAPGADGTIPPVPVWAGRGVDLIDDPPSAAGLVAPWQKQAEHALTWAGTRRPHTPPGSGSGHEV